jgi:hypothetical protein
MLAYQAEIASESRAKNATLTPPSEPAPKPSTKPPTA